MLEGGRRQETGDRRKPEDPAVDHSAQWSQVRHGDTMARNGCSWKLRQPPILSWLLAPGSCLLRATESSP